MHATGNVWKDDVEHGGSPSNVTQRHDKVWSKEGTKKHQRTGVCRMRICLIGREGKLQL